MEVLSPDEPGAQLSERCSLLSHEPQNKYRRAAEEAMVGPEGRGTYRRASQMLDAEQLVDPGRGDGRGTNGQRGWSLQPLGDQAFKGSPRPGDQWAAPEETNTVDLNTDAKTAGDTMEATGGVALQDISRPMLMKPIKPVN